MGATGTAVYSAGSSHHAAADKGTQRKSKHGTHHSATTPRRIKEPSANPSMEYIAVPEDPSSAHELTRVAKSIADTKTDAKTKRLLQQYDTDGDGVLSGHEVVAMADDLLDQKNAHANAEAPPATITKRGMADRIAKKMDMFASGETIIKTREAMNELDGKFYACF
eukprot:SAG11_NODE_627_length_8087_cov_3.567852_3_plen_166_part_00